MRAARVFVFKTQPDEGSTRFAVVEWSGVERVLEEAYFGMTYFCHSRWMEDETLCLAFFWLRGCRNKILATWTELRIGAEYMETGQSESS